MTRVDAVSTIGQARSRRVTGGTLPASKLIDLAHFDFFFRRLQFLRWVVRSVLFIFIAMTFLSGAGSSSTHIFFGLFFIILPAEIILDLFRLFLRQEIGKQEASNKKKGEGMTYRTAILLVSGRRSPLHFWYLLTRDDSVTFVLNRLGLASDQIYRATEQLPPITTWYEAAKKQAHLEEQPVSPKHLFEVIAAELQPLWQSLAISDQMRHDVWQWHDRVEAIMFSRQRGFVNQVTGSAGIGRDWSSGYTRYLEAFAIDVSEEFERLGTHLTITGHEEEQAKVVEYLSRNQRHNVVLVGEQGIGKERMLYAFASGLNKGILPQALRHKRLYTLDVGRVVSGGSQEQVEARLHGIFSEAIEVGNVILAVADFELLVGGQGSKTLGVIDASGVMTQYLQSDQLQFIAAITPEAYYAYVKPNAALEQFLLPVEVKEIKSQEALQILEDEVFKTEFKTKRFFTYQALEKIISVADEHVHDRPYPEKALGLLDEVAGAMSVDTDKIVTPQKVETILSTKLKVPLGTPGESERDALNNLEATIRSRIVGQAEAVQVVANALRRARAGLNSGKRPIGSFLFLGPTGVGKTEMAKTIAALYYKNAKAFIRVDMSEYQTPESIEKLIGARDKPGLLTTAITDQPFSVVLLDEIEKADAGIRNLFLQILDDGHITDGFGKRVDFTNAMVIATSNAGAQVIREAVKNNAITPQFKAQLLDYLQSQGVFAPEWLNRFDAIVTFLPLNQQEILQVAKLQVQELVEKLKNNNINLTLNDDVYDILIQKGYDPEFGARPMRRAVQDTIESALAKVLLNDSGTGVKNITLTRDLIQ